MGGYLKIAPEHTEEGPLSKMMKPGMGSYDRFKELFDTFSKQAGKEQYLIRTLSLLTTVRAMRIWSIWRCGSSATVSASTSAELLSVTAR